MLLTGPHRRRCAVLLLFLNRRNSLKISRCRKSRCVYACVILSYSASLVFVVFFHPFGSRSADVVHVCRRDDDNHLEQLGERLWTLNRIQSNDIREWSGMEKKDSAGPRNRCRFRFKWEHLERDSRLWYVIIIIILSFKTIRCDRKTILNDYEINEFIM